MSQVKENESGLVIPGSYTALTEEPKLLTSIEMNFKIEKMNANILILD